MKASDAYKGKYVSVIRWPLTPEEHLITFAGVEDDRFNTANGALVIYVQLDNQEEKYRVNQGNSAELVKAYGDEIEDWIGHTVTLQRVQATIRGQRGWAGQITPVSEAKPPAPKPPRKR